MRDLACDSADGDFLVQWRFIQRGELARIICHGGIFFSFGVRYIVSVLLACVVCFYFMLCAQNRLCGYYCVDVEIVMCFGDIILKFFCLRGSLLCLFFLPKGQNK